MNNLIGISGKIGSGKDTVGRILQMLNQGIDSDKQIIDYINGTNITGFEYQIKKYADKLKDIVCLLIGCTREQLEDREFKEKELGEEWWHYHYEDYDDINILYGYLEYKERENELPRKAYLVKLTPRKLLQLLGTDCGREIIHPNIWVNALFADYKTDRGRWDYKRFDGKWVEGVTEKDAKSFGENRYRFIPYIPNWIITDVRFPNEAQAIKDRGGIVIRVNRPLERLGNSKLPKLKHTSNNQHYSETVLDDYEFDYVIDNNGSIEELIEKVKQLNLV